MCSRDDHPPYDDGPDLGDLRDEPPTDDEMGYAKDVTIDAAIAARSGFPPAGGWQSPLGRAVRRFLDRPVGLLVGIADAVEPEVPVAYATLPGSDDYVRAEPTPPLRSDEAPFWAVVHVQGHVTFHHGRPTVRDLQNAVGGFIELVPGTLPEYAGFCCDDAKHRQPRWAANPSATRFVGLVGDVILGPVVLVGAEENGILTPLPAHVRARLVHEVIEGGRS